MVDCCLHLPINVYCVLFASFAINTFTSVHVVIILLSAIMVMDAIATAAVVAVLFFCSRVVPNCVISLWWSELNYQVYTLLVVGGGLFGDNGTLVFPNAVRCSRGIVWCGCGNNG